MIAAMYILITDPCVAAYANTRTLAWQQQHRPGKALFLPLVVSGVMLIWNGLYHRKVRRQAESGAHGSGN